MTKAFNKICTFCTILAIILLIVVVKQWPDDLLHIVFCDVGQGDAILIKSGFYQVLIDAGPDDKALTCLRKHIPSWDRQLEVVVATHLDHDHVGGLAAVLTNYQVQTLFLADTDDSDSFKKMAKAIEQHQPSTMTIEPGNSGQKLRLGDSGGEILFLAPSNSNWVHTSSNLDKIIKKYSATETMLSDKKAASDEEKTTIEEDRNDRSIVLLLRLNHFSALLMADAPVQQELALIKKGLIKDIDLLKIGHHGSKTSTGSDFLEISQPEISAISCGLNNMYSHPSQQVLNRLQQQSVQTLRTDQLGEIELITNGFYYWTTTEK